MADTKTLDLATLTALDDADIVMVIDVSDTTMDASGTNKQITVANLRATINGAIEETVISSPVASVEFLNLDGRRYEIEYTALVVATSNAVIDLEVSTDNGSTWKTSGYESIATLISGSQTGLRNIATTAVRATGSVGTADTETSDGFFKFGRLDDAAATHNFYGEGIARNDAGAISISRFGGAWETAGAINAVRIKASGGNLTSGSVALYGR